MKRTRIEHSFIKFNCNLAKVLDQIVVRDNDEKAVFLVRFYERGTREGLSESF